MAQPFFSVVYPTRNRPHLLKYCLEAMQLQTFNDFEVIVCDNHTGLSAKSVFDSYADDKRFRYVTPPQPLPMHENWEYAAGFAQGDYVSVFTDKVVLLPSALQIAHQAILQHNPEIISWWNEGYELTDEHPETQSGYEVGIYRPVFPSAKALARPYDPMVELQRRLDFKIRRDREGVHFARGKICYGAYRRTLIQRIKEVTGRLFHLSSPDYTSLTSALALAESAVEIEGPLQFSFDTKISNGKNCSLYPDLALKYTIDADPTLAILEQLPLKQLYASQHNHVAGDYCHILEKTGHRGHALKLNLLNLILRAREDLGDSFWSNEQTKKEQFEIWRNYFYKLPKKKQLEINLGYYYHVIKAAVIKNRGRLARYLMKTCPLFFKQIEKMLQRTQYQPFSNIIEALQFAEVYYQTKMHSV